jgi:predicted dehydrogenase
MKLRCLVVGYGSIGARHAVVLEDLGNAVSIVSRRSASGGRPVFRTLGEAFDAGPFDYVVVAAETAQHEAMLAELAAQDHAGLVLVEKPLFAAPAPLPPHRFRGAGVGYNLRFHPAVRALQAGLAGRRAEIADLYVGQWLGDWRPDRTVAATYSASRAAGGGALRDLSHELDLVTWLFGPWRQVAALGGRLSDVTVDADDGWGIVLSCERCPVVTLQLNYLDRIGRRSIAVQSGGETLHADLIANKFTKDRQSETYPLDRNASYTAMHQALIAGSGAVPTFEEGLRTVELIAAIEQAARAGSWVERKSA